MPTRSVGKRPHGEVGVPHFLRDSTQLQAARASHKVPNHFDLGIVLKQLGEQIKLARKGRKLTSIQVAERTGIDRKRLDLHKP